MREALYKMPQAENERDRRYHLSPYVRYVDISGRVTILDIRSESYFALEPVASHMWIELAKGHAQPECLENIIREMGPGGPELAADLAAFAQQCVDKGLLTFSRETLPCTNKARQVRHISAIRAWLWLARTSRSLSSRGFCRTYVNALNTPCPTVLDARDAHNRLNRALRVFSRAENFFHLKKAPLDCLPRSLAIFRFLRESGLPAEHCIGIRQFPFTAHAWTECDGRVVHDDPSNPQNFSVIARIGR